MPNQSRTEKIIIIDFGSQVTKLIARRIRELGVFSEILTIKELKIIKDFNNIKGIILSGGPATVTNKRHSRIPKSVYLKKIPILRTIYSAIGQMTETFAPKKGSKKSVVLIEYPRKGSWAVGFATKENKGEI